MQFVDMFMEKIGGSVHEANIDSTETEPDALKIFAEMSKDSKILNSDVNMTKEIK